MTERQRGLVGLFLQAAVVVGGLAVVWGSTTAKLDDVREEVRAKADRAVVEVQYEAILREIRGVNERLGRLEARR